MANSNRPKKKDRNVIVRRVKSSHNGVGGGSNAQSRKGSRLAHETTLRSLSRATGREDPSRDESSDQMVGQAMLERLVHNNEGGLTGDQIIELTELANRKEQEQRALFVNSPPSRRRESSSDEHPLDGAFSWKRSKTTHGYEQGSGAKRIQKLLDLGENEILQDEVIEPTNPPGGTDTSLELKGRKGKRTIPERATAKQSHEKTVVLANQRPSAKEDLRLPQVGKSARQQDKKTTYQSLKQKSITGLSTVRNSEKENAKEPPKTGLTRGRVHRNISKQLLEESRADPNPFDHSKQPLNAEPSEDPYAKVPRTGIEQPFLLEPP